MNNTTITILIIIFEVLGLIVAYNLGKNRRAESRGKIVITDSDNPEFQGKVQFIFEDEIEDLIMYKTITLDIENQLTKKYNHDNEESN